MATAVWGGGEVCRELIIPDRSGDEVGMEMGMGMGWDGDGDGDGEGDGDGDEMG